MDIKLKSLHLENFKGIKDKTYTFGFLTRILGMNRRGKTTIGTGWYWLFSDKNYELVSNPNIRPDDVEECIPAVTAVLDVDGREITAAKMQKRKLGKPDSNGVSKVTLTNAYTINDVPKTERDFKAYFEDLGFSFENFLVCSHPDVFTGQKTADMRKVLFKMASEKTDYDIASMSAETADVAKLLADYKFEEIEAMQKASKKKATEQVNAIPNQIVGLEKAKVDIDVAEQELAKASLERQIAEIDAKIKDAGSVVSDLRSEDMQLQFDMSGIMQTMNRELSNKRNSIDAELFGCRTELDHFKSTIPLREKQISDNKSAIEAAEKKRSEFGAEYNAEKAKVFDETPYLFHEEEWEFDESEGFCKQCGRRLPDEDIEEIKADFEKRKAKAKADVENSVIANRARFEQIKNDLLEEIKVKGFDQKHIIEDLTAKNEELQAEIKSLKKQEHDTIAKQNELSKQLDELPAEADYSQNEEYVKLKARHDEVLIEIAKADSLGHDELLFQFEEEKKELLAELDSVKEKIAQQTNNVRIDEQISELQEKQRDYEQAKADAEKILYQLSLVSKKKNELLVEEINQHFAIVKWRLFDYQKNGEYKETCIPTVLDEETGIYKLFGDTTNTGREIEAKLDICNSFQKFFGMQVPIFLDGAESINDEYLPKVDTQLILLTVTKDRELKVEVE